jgi:thiamine-monophosphate kinase
LAGDWLQRFLNGFMTLAEVHKTPLAGGDLAESPLAVADIVLTGAVPRGKALLRSGARPGDLIYVTGSLGGSAAGLAELARCGPRAAKSQAAQLAPHFYPQPRIAQGLWLAKRAAATAAMDISDGLSTDLAHLCEESRVAAEIDAMRLPVFAGAELSQALHGGEDYELLFTAKPRTHIPRSIRGVKISCVGRIVKAGKGKPRVAIVTEHGKKALQPGGWQHFA